MRSPSLKTLLIATSLCSLFASVAHADNGMDTAALQDDALSALTHGTAYWQERYRYENVHQDGFADSAQANTLRSVLGYKTGDFHHFQVEGALLNVAHFGDHRFNDGVDGKTQFPTIGDPGDTQLYIANLSYTGIPQTTIVGGRQKISFDNERWVGTGDWRQIAQTFDGLTIENKSIDNLDLFYGHVFHENRAPGNNASNGTYEMDGDLFHAAYTGLENVKFAGYAYLSDNDIIKTLSSGTTGLRVQAVLPAGGQWKVTGTGEYARQFSYGNDPQDYGLNYFLLEPGASYGKLAGKVGYEVLGSNGSSAVQSPMMSEHPMNGWADMFATTPVNGLQDSYANVAYSFKIPCSWLGDSKVEGSVHSFSADKTGTHYGNEYDITFNQKIAEHYTVGAQYANYLADKMLTDTRKFTVTLQLDY